MTHQQMWKAYCQEQNPGSEYSAWKFGDDPDTLAKLVLEGTKTATASLHMWYEDGSEPIPKAGDYSIILNTQNEAVCIIRTTKVYTVPFSKVSADHAFLEGEGDRTLDYWRKVHEEFFSEKLKAVNIPFSPDMPVICEEFEKVYS